MGTHPSDKWRVLPAEPGDFADELRHLERIAIDVSPEDVFEAREVLTESHLSKGIDDLAPHGVDGPTSSSKRWCFTRSRASRRARSVPLSSKPCAAWRYLAQRGLLGGDGVDFREGDDGITEPTLAQGRAALCA